MNIDKHLYMGRDYLPSTYHKALNTPNNKAVVCDAGDNIVGYAAGHLVDNGKTLVLSSGRVKNSHRGQGHTKLMLGVIRDHFLCESGKVKQEVLVTKGESLANTKNTFHDEYNEVLQRALINFIIQRDTSLNLWADPPCFKTVQNLSNYDLSEATSLLANKLTQDADTTSHHLCSHDVIITNWTPFAVLPSNAETIIKSSDIVLLSDIDSPTHSPDFHYHVEDKPFCHNLDTNSHHTNCLSKPVFSNSLGGTIQDNHEFASVDFDEIENPYIGKKTAKYDENESQHSMQPQGNQSRNPSINNCKGDSAVNLEPLRYLNNFKRPPQGALAFRDFRDFSNFRKSSVLSVGNYFPCKLGLAYNIDLYFSNDTSDYLNEIKAIGCHMRRHVIHALDQGHDTSHILVFVDNDGGRVQKVCDTMASFGLIPAKWDVKNVHMYRRST